MLANHSRHSIASIRRRSNNASTGRSISFSVILFVQDVQKRHGIEEARMERDYPHAWDWLLANKSTLLKRSSQSIKHLMEKHAFYSMFAVGDYTLSPWKVGWKYIASELTCAVIRSTRPLTIPDHRVIIVSCNSEQEAHFVAGMLNSTLARLAAGFFIIETQIAPSILDSIRVPAFDPSSKLHNQICGEAKRLATGATDTGDPIHPKLDELCAQTWGITEKELNAVEDAYVEWYRPRGNVGNDAEVASVEND